MSALVAMLLELARMESGHVPLELEDVDLAETVRECWTRVAPRAAERALRFQAPGRGPLVRADRVALSILVGNLLRNAVDHSPEGETIGCEISSADGRCRLVLSNLSNGLRPEDIDKLAEPFWRAMSLERARRL